MNIVGGRAPSSGLTRRELLRRASEIGIGLGLGANLLAACGGEEERGGGGEVPGGGTAGTINFLSWQGYDLQGFKPLVRWEKDNDITFRSTFINTHEDIQAKVTQSPGTYNLVTYYQGYWELYRNLNILSPLDPELVPNLEKNYPVFQDEHWWNSDGELWGVPFTWGSWVLVYNPDEMAKPSSWQDLLSPKLKDRVAIIDDPNCAMLVGGRVLGYELPNLTQNQVDNIIDFYRDVRKNARLIAPSMGDVANLFSSGEVIACIPPVNTLEGLIKQQGASAASAIPKEGSATFCDAWAIPPETEDVETAHAWIDHALTPDVQAYTGNSLAQGITQPGAVGRLDPTVAELFPYDDLDAWIEQAPLFSLPSENDPQVVNFQGWLNAWAAFKAEG
jgi:spermidine/putrescine transport system substrate-binding protein